MKVWYHAGTGTYMPVNDCVVVHVPDDLDDEEVISYLEDVNFERLPRQMLVTLGVY